MLKFPSVLAMTLAVIGAETAYASTYSWSWQLGDTGVSTNEAGKINWVESSINLHTRELSWTANFSEHGGRYVDGFSLLLTNGVDVGGQDGMAAVLYFDASRLDSPVMNAFTFNGMGDGSSYRDGGYADGIQDANGIATTQTGISQRFDGLSEMSVVDEGLNRTMSFTISLDRILSYGSAHDLIDWYGMGFDEDYRATMFTYSDLATSYDSHGYLTDWSFNQKGVLSTGGKATPGPGGQPVPEPATLTLLGMGLAGVAMGRRRRS